MNLDKFYTKEEVARYCISLIDDLESYDTVVEPSAGSGNFSKNLSCISYDIEPEDESIIKQDYLALSDKFEGNRILVIGNPPFGKRSSLAKKFISHSIRLGATTIAFVLPDTFNKFTNQKVFPNNWKLIKKEKLEGTNFEIDGRDYYVPCTFFIWTSDEGDVNLREEKVDPVDSFVFLPRGDTRADFTINGNSGKVKSLREVTNSKAEHYIYVIDRSNIESIKEFFSKATYNFNSSVNGNNAWISQQDILKYYTKNFKN